jgi:diguanylate cyclase (GGDEF)-like protein
MPTVPAPNGLLDLAPSDPDAFARVPSAEEVAKAVLDEGRLTALRATELLDSLDEEAFDRFTRLAAALLHAPVSLVTLLDAERAFFKSSWGLPEDEPKNREAPLTTSLCKHVVAAAAPLLIGDARLDARFQDNPLVQDETIVAYAGIPLTLSSGHTLGSFCAVDVLPRVWEENEITVLKDLGAAVVAEIEFRSAAREAARSATEARLAESLIVAENRVLSLILADAPMATVVRELEDLVRVRPLGLRARIVFTDPPDDASPPPGSPTALASAAPSSGHAEPRAIQWSTPIRRLGGSVAGAVVSSVEGAVEPTAVTLSEDIARLAELALDRREAAATLVLEARRDPVTGLANRRQLFEDLEQASRSDTPALLILYDLDGFKQYNDSFGHPAGDALLSRLGARLGRAVEGIASAYRMGGDEFCILLPDGEQSSDGVVAAGTAALAERGEAFSIACSHGSALVEGGEVAGEEAMRLADQRLYAGKQSSRASASRQSTDVLLSVLAERHPGFGEHSSGVAALAMLTAGQLGLDSVETRIVGLAAELHDVGKMAIPDAILDKRAQLDDAESAFMQRHTVIGERIVAAAPALMSIAPLVRSSHERVDGRGYPDGLSGAEIPLASRIVAVCDAFDAMVSGRHYRDPVARADATAELRRCAGTQFDPSVVEAFSAVVADGPPPGARPAVRPLPRRAGDALDARPKRPARRARQESH